MSRSTATSFSRSAWRAFWIHAVTRVLDSGKRWRASAELSRQSAQSFQYSGWLCSVGSSQT